MFNTHIKRIFSSFEFNRFLSRKEDLYKTCAYSILNRFRCSKAAGGGDDESRRRKCDDKIENNLADNRRSPEGKLNDRWKPEIAWLGKAFEPALQLYKWALPTGNGIENKPPPTGRSLSEIFSSIQRSKLSIQDWSLSDLTIGLYLLYLRQASENYVDDVKGELISSESIVQDLIYHTELAKGAYKDNAAALARNSMIREKNIVKFVQKSSVLRPGYYIGVDTRKKLIILGIRGTHTVSDLITDIISSGHDEMAFKGYSTHFGTAEATRWFLNHEIDTIKNCLEKHKGFRLRLVGHSLGGAIASLIAIKLRKKSMKELGFSPDIISAVGYATPPCVSKELAESCADFVTTVVMQDDIIPRLSAASLKRLRNEIIKTDWESVFSREDWKGVIDLVTNAKQVVSSVQDVARKLSEYAKFRGQTKYSEMPTEKEVSMVTSLNTIPDLDEHDKQPVSSKVTDDFFVPGTLYYLKRNVDAECHHHKHVEYFTLLRRNPGEHLQRILLSSNLISDHKCDTHFYALRDVLKGLPSCVDYKDIDN